MPLRLFWRAPRTRMAGRVVMRARSGRGGATPRRYHHRLANVVQRRRGERERRHVVRKESGSVVHDLFQRRACASRIAMRLDDSSSG